MPFMACVVPGWVGPVPLTRAPAALRELSTVRTLLMAKTVA